MADAAVLKTVEGNLVRVRLPPSAPSVKTPNYPSSFEMRGLLFSLGKNHMLGGFCEFTGGSDTKVA
jgi:hypothetical protein